MLSNEIKASLIEFGIERSGLARRERILEEKVIKLASGRKDCLAYFDGLKAAFPMDIIQYADLRSSAGDNGLTAVYYVVFSNEPEDFERLIVKPDSRLGKRLARAKAV